MTPQPGDERGWAARRVPVVFLLLGSLLGTAFAFLVPPNQVPDEWGHFVRAWDVSYGRFVASPESPVPSSFVRLRERYSPALDHYQPPHRRMLRDEWLGWFQVALQSDRTETVRARGANLYSFLPYLPAGVAVGAARVLSLPILVIIYIGRLTNLAFYVFIIWLALRLLPDFHFHLFALALMPMSLHQAASLSADSATISLTFLWIAFVLRLAYSPEVRFVTPRQQILLAVLAAAVSFCKSNVWLMLLVLLIPSARYESRRRQLVAVAVPIAVALSVAAAWQYLNRVNVEIFARSLEIETVFARENLRFAWTHPGAFLSAVGRTLIDLRYFYRQSFIGSLGHLTIPLPLWLINGYSIFVLAVAVTQTLWIRISKSARMLFAAIVAASTLSLFVLILGVGAYQNLIVSEFPNGRGHLLGIQGRYFIPFAPLGLFLFSNRRFHVDPLPVTLASTIWVLTANATAYHYIWNSFFMYWNGMPR